MSLSWTEPSKGDRAFIAEVVGAFSAGKASDVFRDAWRFLMTTVVPLNERADWDHIRCEFWLDSGRCVIFVAHAEKVDRIDRGCCQIVSRDLMSVWERCASRFADSDEDFSRAIVEEERKLMSFAVDAANAVAKEMTGLRGVDIEFWDADASLLESYTIG
ncbi:MAG: hypothetical protein QM790_03415 [Nibricoccus sp.]